MPDYEISGRYTKSQKSYAQKALAGAQCAPPLQLMTGYIVSDVIGRMFLLLSYCFILAAMDNCKKIWKFESWLKKKGFDSKLCSKHQMPTNFELRKNAAVRSFSLVRFQVINFLCYKFESAKEKINSKHSCLMMPIL